MSKTQMIRRRGLSAFLAMAMCFGLLPAQRSSFSRIVYFGESDCRFHTAQFIADLRHDSAECFSADETFRVDHDVHLSEISSL